MSSQGQRRRASRRRNPVPRPAPEDPTGRVDILAMRLLERAVSLYGDLAIRTIYGSYREEINRALKRRLGRVRVYFDGIRPILVDARRASGEVRCAG